jgi:N-methylhydantoinase B
MATRSPRATFSLANDPHSGGGLHPQDVSFSARSSSTACASPGVALAAHNDGHGRHGFRAPRPPRRPNATRKRCACRRGGSIGRHEEASDIWNILRINSRSADLIEMDMRSLVIGSAVAEAKLIELVREWGWRPSVLQAMPCCSASNGCCASGSGALEDGHYFSTAWIEWGG